jgi:catechol 2,3-dioxygenase-like lactoylglutathione lyase family enzyme
MGSLLDHIDLRVRDRAAATGFYDAFLALLGAVRHDGATFTTWRLPPAPDAAGDTTDNFGITEDPAHRPGAGRIAFKASSRNAVDAIATLLPNIGAQNVEMDDGIYGDGFYGVFFEDADGNRLEVCVNTP